jgi:CelD/BcsL family acetyltransferase involved in cellulose biosynthesis
LIIAESPVATSTKSASMVVSAYRGGVEVIERWADDWRDLCVDSVDEQPFYHPEWIAAHIRAFTPKANGLLLMGTCDGRLHMALPLLEERALFYGLPVRRLRAPVNGHTCRFDAVRRPGPQGDLALQALWEYWKSLPTWDLVEVSYMPIGGTLSALALAARSRWLSNRAITDESKPVCSHPSGPAEPMPVAWHTQYFGEKGAT